MKRIETILRHSKLQEVVDAVKALGVPGITVLEARGFGRQRGHKEVYRGSEYTVDFLPKAYMVMFVSDEMAPKVVECILKAAHTGEIGDGKVFVSDLEHAFRIRTQETGDQAL